MKLAIVRQAYTPFGGAERFVERAAEALQSDGVSITIVARRWTGMPAYGLEPCDPFYVGRVWRDAGFARCVRRLIAGRRFDLVQSHERVPGCDIFRAGDGVHATWLAQRERMRGWPARLSHALSPWHRYTLAAERRVFADPGLKAVICNSQMVRDDIARRFSVPDGKLHVVFNGIDLAAYSPELRERHRLSVRHQVGVDNAIPVILFVGSGFERKGLGVLIDAFAAMDESSAQLWVVGLDKHAARYEAQARRRGVADRVRFLGPQQDVKPYYGAADAFALPTLYDPFPNAVLEAWACGLPVVTSDSCGAAELVDPGRNGYVCDALDVAGLARALDALCGPGVAESLRAAARRTAEPLSICAMAERLGGLYRQLLREAVWESARLPEDPGG
ncbi:MAG: glycosyltransferase family 4 protein [Rhodocyclaceae bacterium]